MNGQMLQICCITAAARKALKEESEITYTPQKYENRIMFDFLPEKRFFGRETYTAQNVAEWFERCRKKGLQDMRFLAPVSVQDRHRLGFSNTTESSIACFYPKEQVTFFTAGWEFDSIQKEWNILYTEHEWPDPPPGRPHFEDNTETFKKVLSDIRDLAVQIECNGFANVFQKALDILSGIGDDEENFLLFEKEANRCLFEAARTADVFGAMGSWNDSPPYMAHEKGLGAEYESLSAELLKNIRLGLLYAVNEQWENQGK